MRVLFLVDILLIGKAGSGKDTVADYLVSRYEYTRFAFADKLKMVAEDLFPDLCVSRRRQILQSLGLKMRELDEEVWIKQILEMVKYYKMSVITDCRFQNEYDILTGKHGFIPVKVNCDDNVRAKRIYERDGVKISPAELSHISEQLDVPCDCHLDNNFDVQALYRQIDKMMEGMK